MASFTKTASKITPEDTSQKVSSITVRLYVYDCTGTVYMTDLLLQPGGIPTGWVGHPSEIQWTLDG